MRHGLLFSGLSRRRSVVNEGYGSIFKSEGTISEILNEDLHPASKLLRGQHKQLAKSDCLDTCGR